MKRLLLLAVIAAVAVALVAAAYYAQLKDSGRAGFPAPDFSLNSLAGQPYRLSDYRGRIVFLNVWATWCAPCREEMPSMERLYRRLKGKDFVMLAVSEDEGGAAVVQRFVEEMGITFPVLLDSEGTVPKRYGVTGYPETFIINRNGQVIKHIIGPENWGSEPVYRYFASLLEAASGTTEAAGAPAPNGG